MLIIDKTRLIMPNSRFKPKVKAQRKRLIPERRDWLIPKKGGLLMSTEEG